MLCLNCGDDFDAFELDYDRKFLWCEKCRKLAEEKDHFGVSLRHKHFSKGKFYATLKKQSFCCACCNMPLKKPYEGKNVIIDFNKDKKFRGLICQSCSGIINFYNSLDDIEMKSYKLECMLDYLEEHNVKI